MPRTPARHLLIVRGVLTENSQTLILKLMQEFSLRSNGKGRQRRVLASARTVRGATVVALIVRGAERRELSAAGPIVRGAKRRELQTVFFYRSREPHLKRRGKLPADNIKTYVVA